jgi:putative ABC transport system substrate-binding protein
MAKDGGLMAYGIDVNDNYRKAAQYVARILNGTAAGWLPIQQPTHFYFIVNGKVANELGLDLPATIQARAHEIID